MLLVSAQNLMAAFVFKKNSICKINLRRDFLFTIYLIYMGVDNLENEFTQESR